MAITMTGILTILVIAGAYLYYKHTTSQEKGDQEKRVLAVLDGLIAIERENPLQGTPKVACGFASNMDYFIDSLELLEAMELNPPDKAKPHDVVKNEKELLETFAFFFNHSAASS